MDREETYFPRIFTLQNRINKETRRKKNSVCWWHGSYK